MTERDHILILRSLAGETSPEEERLIGERRHSDPLFAGAYDRSAQLGETLRDGAAESFGPSFAERTLERLERLEREERGTLRGTSRGTSRVTVDELITRLFARFAPIGVALALILGLWNLTTAEEGTSTVEAALGLAPVDLAAGYSTVLSDLDPIDGFSEEKGE